jgi:hypothetical protein
LKSLKGRTKAEEEGPRGPFLLNLRPPLKALQLEPLLKKNWWKTAEPRVHCEGTDPLLKDDRHIWPAAADPKSALRAAGVENRIFVLRYSIAKFS